jgi:hypothetical protein
VAQPGSALVLGTRGPRFESGRPDQWEGSTSFLQKGSKKLLLTWGMGLMALTPQAQSKKVFLLLFLQKKKCLLGFCEGDLDAGADIFAG